MKRTILCCAISAALAAWLTTWAGRDEPSWPTLPPAHAQPGDFALASGPTPAPPSLTPEEVTNIRVYDSANRGVVNINTRTVTRDRFFMLPVPGQGAGSGTVLDTDGHILTNFHVVDGASAIQVTLSGGESYEAVLIGHDREQDIAVLKIDAPTSELHPIPLGDSENLKVGQRVYTLGNPFGLEGTLTTGIISNLNRTLPSRVTDREMKSIIQTDAAMNPGNSGGPLLDTGGRMIGMNVAIATRVGQNAGVGFAIPVNRIRQIVPELIEHGRVVRADIGIVAVMETDQGLLIVRTNEGGPADRAGLRGPKTVRRRITRGGLVYMVEQEDRSQADLIVAVDGEPMKSGRAFIEKIQRHRPGDRIVVTVIRGGEPVEVSVTLGAS